MHENGIRFSKISEDTVVCTISKKKLEKINLETDDFIAYQGVIPIQAQFIVECITNMVLQDYFFGKYQYGEVAVQVCDNGDISLRITGRSSNKKENRREEDRCKKDNYEEERYAEESPAVEKTQYTFKCRHMGQMIDLCKALSSFTEESFLYKDSVGNYCLTIKAKNMDKNIFGAFINIGSEWCDTAIKKEKDKSISVIISENAINALEGVK